MCMIDATEGRSITTADIPGAFLQTNQTNDKELILWITGTMEKTLAKLDLKVYWNKIIDRNEKKTLYAKYQKAIYGTLCAAILFYKNITYKLAGPNRMGFTPNPKDAFTMNKIINGS